MKDDLAEAKRIFRLEGEALRKVGDKLDENFVKAVELLLNCKGRIIITGMGKSGLIGKKIASTFSSTGTPAFFLNAAEAKHGDLGIVTSDDLVIAISYSGTTEEVVSLLPYFKRFGVKVIAITGKLDSPLAKSADVTLDVGVEKEACPLGIVPTSSATATLVMGDALASALLRRRNFKREDFAILHPGGTLGKKLLLRVRDLMHSGYEHPMVNHQVTLKEAIFEMTSKGLGITSVIDDEGKLVGVVTDGDLRRILEKKTEVLELPVSQVMTKNPKTIKEETLAAEALRVMEDFSITALIVVDKENHPYATIHLHDILKAGIA
ncbi:MAG: KpsF/GutQ family sugar-phosphate isomerase [Acidobacteria bacterium]|nr:KpsF/GutQ family sugar-phosphate isomerase [Acidobacteriota bacterium]